MLKLADIIERRVAAATAGKLTQAMLAKAFCGEPVPTEAELARREGRSYEPASVSLERIRQQRAAQVPARRGRAARQFRLPSGAGGESMNEGKRSVPQPADPAGSLPSRPRCATTAARSRRRVGSVLCGGRDIGRRRVGGAYVDRPRPAPQRITL